MTDTPKFSLQSALYDAAVAYQKHMEAEKGRYVAMERLTKELKAQGCMKEVADLVQVKKENGQWVPVH